TSLSEPGLSLLENDWIQLSPVTLLAVAAVVVFSLLHLHSVHIGKGIQNLLTLYKVGFIVLFIILGFTLGDGDFEHFRPSRSVSAEFDFSSFAVALI
ncbi:amino acid permease, partial [Pseudoponticoccus marisrubri]|uniref:amino acid permease n=2 Tax=Pseudomonadota TaxID=1224 RepID=UPI0012FE1CAF